jgi:DNA phosphorothioation-dependent restriction protein DptH
MQQTTGLRNLNREEWLQAIESEAIPYFRRKLSACKPGHCMRVTDLDTDLMVRLCRTLRDLFPHYQFFVLHAPEVPNEVAVTSTKLVELRNPLEDGSQREPLLIFLPHAVKASAEDSFGVATFQSIDVLAILMNLKNQLLEALPAEGPALRPSVLTLFQEMGLRNTGLHAQIRYLLLAKVNGIDNASLGAATFELGLIPDFTLFEKPDLVQVRVRRNQEAVNTLCNSGLTERGRVLSLELSDPLFCKDLAELIIQQPDFKVWSRSIAMEASRWKFSFDKWKFLDDRQENVIPTVSDVRLDIPVFDALSKNRTHAELVGEQVLIAIKQKKFSVEFTVDPIPARIPGLHKFIAKVLSVDGDEGIGLSRQKKVWEGKSNRGKILFSRISDIQWEDGWYLIELSALHENGVDLIAKDSTTHRSEPFYVLSSEAPETTESEDKPKQKTAPTLAHALLAHQFQHLLRSTGETGAPTTSVQWSQEDHCYEARSPQWGLQQIPLSAQLHDWELLFLHNPTGPLSYRAQGRQLQPGIMGLTDSPSAADFLAARKEWCHAILSEPGERVLSSVHPEMLQDVAKRYIDSFCLALKDGREFAKQGNWNLLQELLSLDQVQWTDPITGTSVILLSPTHPNIVRWWMDWWTLGCDWLLKSRKQDPQVVIGARDSLLETIQPMAVPPFLSKDGAQLVYFANLDRTWSSYVPSVFDQRQLLRDSLQEHLGCECSLGNSQSADASFVAQRIKRYLLQHPYIGTFSIRAILPGKGKFLVTILNELADEALFKDLRWDFRLFVTDPQAELEGEELQEMVQSGLLASDELGGDHLRPKFRVAVCSIDELFKEESQVHLTFLFDAFPADQIHAISANEAPQWLKGLIGSESIEYREDGDAAYWLRSFPQAKPVDKAYSQAVAALAVHRVDEPLNLSIQLYLSSEIRRRIHRIHELSDWVFCLDRNLGIEYFDHGGSQKDRPDYLIDHSPNLIKAGGRSLVITSRSTTELQSLIEPCLEQYPLHDNPRLAELLLFELRCLSGRLALKLIANPNQRAEAMGLALARLYLEQNGFLESSILIPLDAHQDLYTGLAKQSTELGLELSLHRTDLALFQFDSATKTLTCKLVEVKCYQGVGTQGWIDLQEKIARQLKQSQEILSSHFKPSNRPDEELKRWELAQLLKYYLRRSIRYRALAESAGIEFLNSLENLFAGYRLEFELQAIVFDFSSKSDSKITDQGIEFQKFGFERIQNMLIERLDFAETSQSLAITFDQIRTLRNKTQTVDWLSPSGSTQTEIAVTPKIPTATIEQLPSVIPESVTPVAQPVSLPINLTADFKNELECSVYLGVGGKSEQFGILGDTVAGKVGLDLNHTHTISLFGVQGGGKSYTLGSILEMACLSIPGINQLPAPLASVVFHYSPTMDYKPEFTSMVNANDKESQIRVLQERYGAIPVALKDIVLVVPPGTFEERKAEYSGLTVKPLYFNPSELKSSHWTYLMGVVGNDSLYIKQVKNILKSLRKGVDIQTLEAAIQNANMPDNLKDQAMARLELAEEYIKDGADSLGSLIVPGRLVIVDMRDEHIEREEALGLFVVLLQLFSEVNDSTKRFNKLFVFDEAHKYMGNSELVNGLIEIVREMRHKGSTILVASQDPPSLPIPLLELSSQIILHKFTSPQWLKHLQKANSSLNALTPEKMASLGKGEAYIWSRESSDPAFSEQAVKIQCRPRATRHGGDTKKALD